MKIDTTKKTTVRDLLALLTDVDPSEEVSYARATKKATVPCWCGCGGTTKSRFVPGHDSRFHSLAKQVARGQANHKEAIASLPHDEAIAEFDRHVALEKPRHAVKEAEKAEKAEQKEADKIARAGQKETTKVAEEFPILPILAS